MGKDETIHKVLLALIIVVAATLRFINLHDFSLTNDELSALSRLRYSSISILLQHGIKESDMHPAGVELFLYVWTWIFGTSVFVVRLPMVLFSLVSIIVLYKIGKQWFNADAGLIAAAMMASLIYPLSFSQIARPYSPGVLFTLLFIYQWTMILFVEIRPSTKRYLILLLTFSLCMYTHYYALFFAGLIAFIGFFFLNSTNRRPYILSLIGVGVLFIPGIKTFVFQFKNGGGGTGGSNGWLLPPNSDWLTHYLYYAFNQSTVLIIFLVLILISGIIIQNKKYHINRFHLMGLSLFFLSFLFGYTYSVMKNPILQYSIMLFSFPVLVLSISGFIAPVVSRFGKIATVVILITATCSTVFGYGYYHNYRFGVFKELVHFSLKWEKTFGEENITGVASVNDPYYLNYYTGKDTTSLNITDYSIKSRADLERLKEIVSNSTTPYFEFCWSTMQIPNEVYSIILDYYPSIVRDRYFPIKHLDNYINSRITLFSKELSSSNVLWCASYPNENINNDTLVDSIFIDSVTNMGYLVKPSNEYALTFIKTLNNKKCRYVNAEVLYKGTCNAQLVISTKSNGKDIEWYSVPLETFFDETNEWEKCYATLAINSFKKGDELRCYIWNNKHEEFRLKEFTICGLTSLP